MLRLLLDEQISWTIADRVNDRLRDQVVISVAHWECANYMASADDRLLLAAYKQSLTLVTYDCRTIAPLLKSWGEQGLPHGGAIFVDSSTLASNDFGGLVFALEQLWRTQRQLDWTNRVILFTPVPPR